MTPEEARERFSDAVEGSLALGEKHAFDRVLESDASLQEEYRRFLEVVEAAGSLSDVAEDGQPPVDLLPGLQARLRVQSKGRFYRDRFAQSRAVRSSRFVATVLAVSVIVLLLTVLWFVFGTGVQFHSARIG